MHKTTKTRQKAKREEEEGEVKLKRVNAIRTLWISYYFLASWEEFYVQLCEGLKNFKRSNMRTASRWTTNELRCSNVNDLKTLRMKDFIIKGSRRSVECHCVCRHRKSWEILSQLIPSCRRLVILPRDVDDLKSENISLFYVWCLCNFCQLKVKKRNYALDFIVLNVDCC